MKSEKKHKEDCKNMNFLSFLGQHDNIGWWWDYYLLFEKIKKKKKKRKKMERHTNIERWGEWLRMGVWSHSLLGKYIVMLMEKLTSVVWFNSAIPSLKLFHLTY